MKIIADSDIPFVKDYFADSGNLVLIPGRLICSADVKDADLLLVRSVTRVDENLLAESSVKFVGSITAGMDHIDTSWLAAHKIVCCNAAGFNAPPVADYVVSVIAALQRKGLLTTERPRAAIIGVGKVGEMVAHYLNILGFKLIFCDPLRAKEDQQFNTTPIEELHDVDLISLHVPLTESGQHPTKYLIAKDFLSRQKRGAVLLNTSRGSVINTKDLIKYGTHLQWCFDVWENEPNIDLSILKQALIATPHIAGYSLQSKMRGIEIIYQAACAQGLIATSKQSALNFPRQYLQYAGEKHHWQDIVLGAFNPIVMSVLMQTRLFDVADAISVGRLFDAMRQEFHYRQEFAFTTIAADVVEKDVGVLRELGFKMA